MWTSTQPRYIIWGKAWTVVDVCLLIRHSHLPLGKIKPLSLVPNNAEVLLLANYLVEAGYEFWWLVVLALLFLCYLVDWPLLQCSFWYSKMPANIVHVIKCFSFREFLQQFFLQFIKPVVAFQQVFDEQLVAFLDTRVNRATQDEPETVLVGIIHYWVLSWRFW